MPVLTALDLSLTATGLFHGDPSDPSVPYVLRQIATPARRDGEADVPWNARRFDAFSGALLAHLEQHRPPLLVMEVTGHAHQWATRDGARVETSRGQEFRAGLGLGRAVGWMDGLLVLASAYGYGPARVETIEAKDAKLRVAGAQGASKLAVKDALLHYFGWRTDDWLESQIDALAAGLGYLRQAEMLAAEAGLRAHAEARGARPRQPPRPARSARPGRPRAPRRRAT